MTRTRRSSLPMAVLAISSLAPAASAQWLHSFPASGTERMAVVRHAPDGGAFLASSHVDSGRNGYDPWILKLDAAGQVEWQVAASAPGFGQAQDVLILPDGSLAVACAFANLPTVLLLDPAGAETGHAEIPGARPNVSRSLSHLALSADGDLLAVGIDSSDGAGSPAVAWVAKLDRAGNARWLRWLPFVLTSFGGQERPRILPFSDGSFAATSAQGGVVRVDAAGTILWHLEFPDATVVDAVQLSDESLVVAFAMSDAAFNSWISVARILNVGVIDWHVDIDGPEAAFARSLAATASDGIVMAGSVSNGPGLFTAWIGTMDSLGQLTSQRAIEPLRYIEDLDVRPDGSLLLAAVEEDVWVASIAGGVLPVACATDRPTSLSVTPAAVAPIVGTGTITNVAGTSTFLAPSVVPTFAQAEATCSASGCRADSSEPDTGCTLIRIALAPGESAALNFCDDAEDWIAFRACAGQSHRIETSSLGAAADTVLELWSPDCGTLLLSDDDGGAQPRSSRIDWIVPADGTYRIRVRQKDTTTGPDRDYVVGLQGPACGPAPWVRRYDGVGAASLEAAYEEADRTVVVGGRVSSPNALRRGWMLDASLAGDVLARTEHGASREAMVNDFVLLPDGTRVVVGRIAGSQGPTIPDGWIARLNESGFPIWSRTFSGADTPVTFNAVEAIPGGLLAVGSMTSEFIPNALVASVDLDGNLRWQRRIGDRTFNSTIASSFRDVTSLTGGTIVAVGGTGTFFYQPTWIVGLDADGNVLWQSTVAGSVQASGSQRALLARPDGRFVLAGSANSGSITWPAWIALGEPDGTLGWQRGFDLGMSANDVSLRDAPEGGFLVAGTQTSVAVGSSLHRFTDDGELEWSRIIRGGASVRDVLPTSDGGILLVGLVGTVGGAEAAWMAKLDALGRLPSGCTEIEPYVSYTIDPAATTTATTYPPDDPRLAVTSLTVWPTPLPTEIDEVCNATATCLPLSIDLRVPATACTVLATALAAGGVGDGPFTYEWDFDWDGVSFGVDATGPQASNLYVAGTYTVAVRVTDSCPAGSSQALESAVVVVGPPTPPVITGQTRRCSADPCTLLEATPGYVTYEWSTGEISPSICVAPVAARSYTVTVTDDSGCAVTSLTHSLAIDRSPQAVVLFSCHAGLPSLEAIPIQGAPPFTYVWSGGETTPVVTVGAGTWDVTVTDATGCGLSLQNVVTGTECVDLREVSGPGRPPLRVTREGAVERIRFEQLPNVPLYDLHVAPIGSWLSSATASGRECWIDTWTDEGDGTLSIARPVPAGSWILITAGNALGEGPAGARSDGTERSLVPLWEPCGAP